MELSDIWNLKKTAAETSEMLPGACGKCRGSGIDFARMKEIHQDSTKDFFTQFAETLAARCKDCGGSGMKKKKPTVSHNKQRVIEDHADDHSGETEALERYLAESLPFDESHPFARRMHILREHGDAFRLISDQIRREQGDDAIPTDLDLLELHDGLPHDNASHNHNATVNHRHIIPILERLKELGRHLVDETYWEPGQSMSDSFWDSSPYMRPEEQNVVEKDYSVKD